MSHPASPLSPEQLHQVEAARRRRRTLAVAAGVAAFNGWSTAVCAALSAAVAGTSAVLGDFSVTALIATVALGALAAIELYGRKLLQRVDPAAPSILALNQLAFLGLIALYCLWRVYAAYSGDLGIDSAVVSSSDLETLGISEDFLRAVLAVTYACVILASAIFNGGCAIYYLTRRKHVNAYLHETPAWVRELEQR